MANISPQLPDTGFLRLSQLIGNPKAKLPISAIIPVSKSTWWAGVKSGRFPKPVKLGPRITAWRVEDIRNLIQLGSDWPGGATLTNKPNDQPTPHRSIQKTSDILNNKH